MYCRCLLVTILVVLAESTVLGQQFRIETQVFRDGSAQAVSENLTLFDGNVIYDFILPTESSRFPQEIVILDLQKTRFVLLDTRRQAKTEILEHELLRMLSELRKSNSSNEKAAFFYNPTFEEHFEFGTGWLTLKSDQMTYRARGNRPENEMLLHAYYRFIDQFARLNVTDPRSLPPFPRLRLNEAIKKYGFIPTDVEVQLNPDAAELAEPIRIQTKHVLMNELSELDRARIDSAKRYWTRFSPMPLREFREKAPVGETGN